jgi:uncharacterized protein (DUF433 family)
MNKPVGTVISAFTEEQASRLTGVSRRQLADWYRDGFFKPDLAADRGRTYSRLYSFRDLVCLKVLAQLRNKYRIPMQHLREVREELAHLGDRVWVEATLYVLGKNVVVEDPTTGAREEIGTHQGVLHHIPLRVVANDMKEEVEKLSRRDESVIGRLERKRGVAENQLVIAGTRIPVRSIQAFAKAGYTVEQIREEYPTLTDADVVAAISAADEAA